MPRFLYNNADMVFLYWFDDHFNLRNEQRLYLKKKIEAFHRWHRKTELSKTALFLEELRHRYIKGIKDEDISWARVHFEELWEKILNHIESDLASFLLTVDESQVLHMKMKLLEKDDLLVEQSKMDFFELHETTVDWAYGVFEDWFGYLDPEQKVKMASWVKPDSKWIMIKLKNRKKTRDILVRLLQSKDNLKDNLHTWIYHPEAHWTDEFKIRIEEKKQEWADFILKVDAITLSHQRKHAANKLKNYADDFSELSNL